MSMFQEFKAFAMRGNVIDLAVGVIIGGAFGKIVDSVVGDLIMPLIAWIMGGQAGFFGDVHRPWQRAGRDGNDPDGAQKSAGSGLCLR